MLPIKHRARQIRNPMFYTDYLHHIISIGGKKFFILENNAKYKLFSLIYSDI